MLLRRAENVEEYIDWVKNARFEVRDLKECVMFEAEEIPRFPVYLEPLEQSINKLYQDMCDGVYHFGREDLPYMDLVPQFGDIIPFHLLLKQINETHRKGLEIDEDE